MTVITKMKRNALSETITKRPHVGKNVEIHVGFRFVYMFF